MEIYFPHTEHDKCVGKLAIESKVNFSGLTCGKWGAGKSFKNMCRSRKTKLPYSIYVWMKMLVTGGMGEEHRC